MDTSTVTFLTSDMVDKMFTLLVVIITAIITGLITYWIGFGQYLKQRKQERVRQTYIENGLGKVIDGTDQLSTTCYLNYGKAKLAFDLLESTVEDPGKAKDIVQIMFSEMEHANLAPNYGILKLAIFNNQQVILLIVKMWMEFNQLAETIRHIVGGQGVKDYFETCQEHSEQERRDFLAGQKNIVREEWNRVIQKYEPLKGHLLRLQIEVDKIDILCIEDIDKIAEQSKIKKILVEIETQYKSEIDKLSNS